MNRATLRQPLTRTLRLLVAALPLTGLVTTLGPAQVARAASFTVDSTDDEADNNPGDGRCDSRGLFSNKCTLRAAIQEANALGGSHVITVPAGTYTLTITGAGEDNGARGDLDIRTSLTIRASGGRAVVRGATEGGVVRVGGGTHLTLTRVRLEGGTADQGGGAFVGSGGQLTLVGSTATGNTADNGGGGGIHNDGTLSLRSGSSVVGNSAVASGGGLHNDGTLEVLDSDIRGNRVPGDVLFFIGGGIFNSSSGQLTLTRSTVRDNTAPSGGGLANASRGTTARVFDSTVSGNSAVGQGGGIFNIGEGGLTLDGSTVSGNRAERGAGIDNDRVLQAVNSTVSGNSATVEGGGVLNRPPGTADFTGVTIANNTAGTRGGGLLNGRQNDSRIATATLHLALLAGNSAPEGSDCATAASSPLTSQGHNLIQSVGGCEIGGDKGGNVTGRDPLLGPLQINGGRTATHALLAGSPAIDAGPKGDPGGDCGLADDQRGLARPQDGDGVGTTLCDIGAFEVATAGATGPAPTEATVAPGERLTPTLGWTVSDGRRRRGLHAAELRPHDSVVL